MYEIEERSGNLVQGSTPLPGTEGGPEVENGCPRLETERPRRSGLAGRPQDAGLFQRSSGMFDATLDMAQMLQREGRGREESPFLPVGIKGHPRLDQACSHMGASGEDWLTKEAMGGLLVD